MIDPISPVFPQQGLDTDGSATQVEMLLFAITSHDWKCVIKVLTSVGGSERIRIRELYEDECGTNLSNDLKREFEVNFGLLTSGLVLKPMEYVAKCIGEAMEGELDVRIIAEMLASTSNRDLDQLKIFYEKQFERKLKEHIHAETSGNLRLLFLNILDNCRRDDAVNVDVANRRAVELMAVLEVTPEKFEKYFVCLITRESFRMLRAIFYEYEKLNIDLSTEKLVELKFSGDLRVAVRTVVDISRNLPNYFAIRINKVIDCGVTDSNTIIRIFISRAEIDLGNIINAYTRIFGRNLSRDLKTHTSKECRRCLIAMMRQALRLL